MLHIRGRWHASICRYWKVKNGIRLAGMPSYVKVLNDTEMWDE